MSKLAGVAAALMVLPVAVACSSEPVEETGADVTSELPESVEDDAAAGAVPGEVAADDAATGASIVDVASANGSFDTLVTAIQTAGLEETLSTEGPYTVFAPTDEAFAALPEGTVEKLVKPENQDALSQVLAYHVVAGEVASGEIEPGAVSTVEGSDVELAVDPAGVTVNGEATVVQPDVIADNGVIHVVDTVLLPPTFDPATLL
ncbi:MAG: fasciclin domain-containing protein [Cyanobacteria bacterium P01_C01_bin.121]